MMSNCNLMGRLKAVAVFITVTLIVACGGDSDTSNVTFDFDLNDNAQGWVAGFADYPVGQEVFYELESDWRQIPAPLESLNGIYLSGNNHSDDLFMYIKRRLTGLKPNTRYVLSFNVEIATNVAMGCGGAGGAPGESVFVKSGASIVEPVVDVYDEGGIPYYRINIDHGNQSQGGNDAIVIGNVANTQTDCFNTLYELKVLNNAAIPFEISADQVGSIWVLFATDSGFEGITSIYFTRVKIIAGEI